LKPDVSLKAGQELLLQATDADTGRDLGTIRLTMMIDWE
jgi:hypothetical protein